MTVENIKSIWVDVNVQCIRHQIRKMYKCMYVTKQLHQLCFYT